MPVRNMTIYMAYNLYVLYIYKDCYFNQRWSSLIQGHTQKKSNQLSGSYFLNNFFSVLFPLLKKQFFLLGKTHIKSFILWLATKRSGV